MRCPECGEENLDDARICELCRALFTKTVASLDQRSLSQVREVRAPARSSVHVGATIVRLTGLVLGVGLGLLLWQRWSRSHQAATLADGADLSAIPMVGEVGLDADGYPRAEPDQLHLRALLRSRRFVELNQAITSLQAQFEADYRKEYWMDAVMRAFGVADPALEPLLNEWIAAMPDAFAPRAARGEYMLETGWVARGAAFARKTSAEQFQRMAQSHHSARTDLEKALDLHPKLAVAFGRLIWIGMANSSPNEQLKHWLDGALTICPQCFQVRAIYLHALRPRWSGGHARMDRFATEAMSQTRNTRMRLLVGFAEEDQCDQASDDKKYAEALDACDRAVARGDYWEFFEQRGKVRARMDNHEGALADFDSALRLSPQRPNLLVRRAYVLTDTKQWDRAEKDLVLARKLDLHAHDLTDATEYLVKWLLFRAAQLEEQGSRAGSDLLYQQALRLDPANREALASRQQAGAVAVGGRPAPADTFEAHKQADDELSAQGQFPVIANMWNDFLLRHPDEARAYLERGGTYTHLGQMDLALQDLDKACQLGLQQGCTAATSVRHRLGRTTD